MTKRFFAPLAMILATPLFAGTPVIDGVLDAGAGYVLMADVVGGPSAYSSFGTDMDASAIYGTVDGTNLYFFIQGRVNTTNNDGILFLLNTDGQTGLAPGPTANLGDIGAGGPFSDTGFNAWRTDFEVDYGWFANAGFNPTVFVDQGAYVSGKSSGFWGQPGLSGTALTDPQDLNGLNGANGPESTMAFDNSANSSGLGSSTGWEIALPLADLGNPSNVEVFAIVVSAGAFFSDDSVPRNYTAVPDPPHIGFNPDFLSGGDFSVTTQNVASPIAALPVQLDQFLVD